MSEKCAYKLFDKACGRDANGVQYCIFHRHHDQSGLDYTKFNNEEEIRKLLSEEIEQKKGEWDGIKFPSGFKFPLNVDFKISAYSSIFTDLEVTGVTFEKTFSVDGAKFYGETKINVSVFKEHANFQSCTFEDEVEFNRVNFESYASFYGSKFLKRVLLKINVKGGALFDNAIFDDAVIFSGWDQVNTKYRYEHPLKVIFQKPILKYFNTNGSVMPNQKLLIDFTGFEKEVRMTNLIFNKPSKVVFQDLNMAKAYTLGTNFLGVRFVGVNWYQEELKRNGLNEILWKHYSIDPSAAKKNKSELEDSYRNIRATLEDNLNYSASADFYIGEMDAQRLQLNIGRRHLFSVVAWYNAVSKYGTSVPTALRMLLLIIILHICITLAINYDVDSNNLDFVIEVAQRSFKLIAFNSNDSYIIIDSISQSWIDIGLKLFGLAQLAMLIFAFRSRIKRH